MSKTSYTTKIINNHKEFEERIEKILQYAEEIIIDLPFQQQKFEIQEKHLILESLILRVCALWEKFLETELILVVGYDPSKLIGEMNIRNITKLNLSLIRAILFSDVFRDFHDIERSKSFFKKYIVNGYNCFNKISSKQVKKIQFIYIIRNYLSHYSEFAKRKLFESYKKEYGLSRFLEPGQFLFVNKGERFSDLITTLKFCSINMKTIFK